MDTPLYDLSFIQGVAKDFVVSNWADANGKLYDLSDQYTARLTVRKCVGDTDTPLLDLVSGDGGQIDLYPLQIVNHFTSANASSLTPLDSTRPIYGSPDSAPKYQAGVYELRAFRLGVQYPVFTGDVFITLSSVTANG